MSKLTKAFWLPSIPPCRCRQEREEEKTIVRGLRRKLPNSSPRSCHGYALYSLIMPHPHFLPLPLVFCFLSTLMLQYWTELLRNHTHRTLKRQVNFLPPPTSLLSVLFLFKTCILCIEWGMQGEQTKFKIFLIVVFEERLLCVQYLPLSQPGLCRIVVCHMQPMYAGRKIECLQ